MIYFTARNIQGYWNSKKETRATLFFLHQLELDNLKKGEMIH